MCIRRIKLQYEADLFDERVHIEERDCAKGPCPLPSTPLILPPSVPLTLPLTLLLTLPPFLILSLQLSLPPTKLHTRTHTHTHNLTKTGSLTHVSHSNSSQFLTLKSFSFKVILFFYLLYFEICWLYISQFYFECLANNVDNLLRIE